MKTLYEIRSAPRLSVTRESTDGGMGWIEFPREKRQAAVIFSWGGGWDHVSVSFSRRCPTWDEMCMVKDMFFYPEECAVQYHPPKSEYVNQHEYCLHLWRPQNAEIPMPPKIFVGVPS